jgi:hypothetical protein
MSATSLVSSCAVPGAGFFQRWFVQTNWRSSASLEKKAGSLDIFHCAARCLAEPSNLLNSDHSLHTHYHSSTYAFTTCLAGETGQCLRAWSDMES